MSHWVLSLACVTTVPRRVRHDGSEAEEEWAADHRGHDPDRQLDRRNGPGTRSQPTRNAAPNSATREAHAVVRAQEQPHQVRDNDADEADRTAERHGAPWQRGTEERETLRPQHVDAARSACRGRARRFGARGSHANTTNATSPSGSAARIGDIAGHIQVTISHRSARVAWLKSARYCTNRITAEKNAFSVTPASSITFVENPRCRAVASA